MTLGMDVGLGSGDFVLDGEPCPVPPQNGARPPNFRCTSIVTKQPSPILYHVRCSQTAGWFKMPLGMKVGLGSVDIVLH